MKICLHCDSKMHAKGLCMKHYQAAHYLQNRVGEPRKVMTPEERKTAQREARRRYREKNPGAAAAHTRKWREEHPEYKAVRAKRQLAYAAANRDQERLRAAKWRAENPDRYAAGRRSYYVRNMETVKQKNRLHREANRELYLMYGRLYKAKKRASGEYVHPSFIGLLLSEQGAACACCSAPFSEVEYHVDHVVAIASGGIHEHRNLQLLCGTCNRRKADRPLMKFLAILEAETCST